MFNTNKDYYYCYVNFEHAQSLTTSLPFLQTLQRSYHASTTLIPFLPRSSGSHYALTFFWETSMDVAGTLPGVTGVLVNGHTWWKRV